MSAAATAVITGWFGCVNGKSMARIFQRCWWMLLLAAGVQSAMGLAFWGTKEPYMADNLGYNRIEQVNYQEVTWFIFSPETTYAPHNLGEEYRWSIPTLYYAYDASFLDYFGARGV